MSNNKITAVIGASPNPDRYSYKAMISLQSHGYTAFPIGIKKGEINGAIILTDKPHLEHIDTVTLYVGPDNQKFWIDYILSLKPKRIIFNPGTANPEFENMAEKQDIEVIHACTLVMLSINQY
jgi:predicted CoA-binding protein